MTISLVVGCALFNGGKKSKLNLPTEVHGKDVVIVKEGDYKFYFNRTSWMAQLVTLTQPEYSDAYRSKYMRIIDSIQEKYSYIEQKVVDEISRGYPAGIMGSRPITPGWATEELVKIHLQQGNVFIEDSSGQAVKTLKRIKQKYIFGYHVIFNDKLTGRTIYRYTVRTQGGKF